MHNEGRHDTEPPPTIPPEARALEDAVEAVDEELPPSPERDPRRMSGRHVEGMLWMDDDQGG